MTEKNVECASTSLTVLDTVWIYHNWEIKKAIIDGIVEAQGETRYNIIFKRDARLDTSYIKMMSLYTGSSCLQAKDIDDFIFQNKSEMQKIISSALWLESNKLKPELNLGDEVL